MFFELFDSESVFKLPIEMRLKVQKRLMVQESQVNPLSRFLECYLPFRA